MPTGGDFYDLVCAACRRRETIGGGEAVARLQAAGLLKRAKDPEAAFVLELLKSAAQGWPCEHCQRRGLSVEPAKELADDEWGMARPCERCGAAIPPERLELFPDSRLCMKCQQQSEKGDDGAAVEYCPRCGSIMQLRQTRGGGVTRYAMHCPACRR